MRIACVVSQFGIGAAWQPRLCATPWTRRGTNVLLGATKAAKALAKVARKRLIQMGDWRDTHRSQ
jgi:hypothetical protein